MCPQFNSASRHHTFKLLMDLFQILTIIFSLITIFLIVWFLFLRQSQHQLIKKLTVEQDKIKNELHDIMSLEKAQIRMVDVIIGNLPYGILMLDSSLKIARINDSAANLFYLDKEKAIGSKTILLFNNKNLEDLIDSAIVKRAPRKKRYCFMEMRTRLLTLTSYRLILKTIPCLYSLEIPRRKWSFQS